MPVCVLPYARRADTSPPHGSIHADVEVRREGGPYRTVRFLVDSGASLSVLPWSVWHALGLEPRRAMRFTLADGRTMHRRLSDCRFRFRGIDAPGPVILGQRHDVALLGTLTLEALGLVLHPFERTLRPMRMMLAAAVRDTVGLRPFLEQTHSASG